MPNYDDEMKDKMKEERDKMAHKKEYDKILDELKRQEQKKFSDSLVAQASGISRLRNKFYQRVEKFNKTLEHNYRTLGTESIAALILEMASSLMAFDEMTSAYKSMLLRQAWLALSQSWPRVTEEKLREIAATKTADQSASGNILPFIVPYLAEVDNNGKLSVHLFAEDSPQADSFQELHQEFVDEYQLIFQNDVKQWIENAVDADGQKLFEIDADNVLRHKHPEPGYCERNDGIVTPHEFHLLRDAYLSPYLKESFGIEFQAKPSEAPADDTEDSPSHTLRGSLR